MIKIGITATLEKRRDQYEAGRLRKLYKLKPCRGLSFTWMCLNRSLCWSGLVYITRGGAANGRVYPTGALCFSWTCLHYSGLSCTWTYLHFSSLCCTWTYLDYMNLCCFWTCLHYRGLYCTWTCLLHRGLVCTTGPYCAAPGRVYIITGAWAAPGRVYTTRGPRCTWVLLFIFQNRGQNRFFLIYFAFLKS